MNETDFELLGCFVCRSIYARFHTTEVLRKRKRTGMPAGKASKIIIAFVMAMQKTQKKGETKARFFNMPVIPKCDVLSAMRNLRKKPLSAACRSFHYTTSYVKLQQVG